MYNHRCQKTPCLARMQNKALVVVKTKIHARGEKAMFKGLALV